MKLYINNFNWRSFFWLFFQNKFKNIYSLNQIKISPFLRILLKTRGIQIKEIFFSTGSIKTHLGETVYLEAYKKNVEFSLILADRIISNINLLNKLNKKYGNNTIKLYFSKVLQTNLFYWILRIYTVKSLSNSDKINLHIKGPNFISKKDISHLFPEINLIFYNSIINERFSFLIEIAKNLFTNYSNFLINIFFRNTAKLEKGNNIFSLLSIQEESIRTDQSLRNQLHWVDIEKSTREYPINVISLNNKSSKFYEIVNRLREKNIFIYQKGIFAHSRKKFKNNSNIIDIKKCISKIYLEIFKYGFNIKSFYLAKTIFLFNRAIDIASACMLLNVKVYLIKESYFHYSDAIQILSKKIGVKTITYQYSNLGLRSPLMMSSSDIFLTFSKSYNTIFKYNSIGPKEFKSIGYINQGIENKIKERVKKLQNYLDQLDIDFVITFFDEANEKSKWLLIHEQDYKNNIKLLAKKIISDKKIAVIVKTQFNRNKISKKFINEPLIIKAIKTGRLIEVFAGEERNDVYPIEVASCSNIIINHKVGGTAGLESVSIDKRCLLIDPYEYKTIHDKVYNNKNIIYSSLSNALEAIEIYRKDCILGIENDLGDWSKIKSYFLEETEPNGIDAINKEVEESLRIYT